MKRFFILLFIIGLSLFLSSCTKQVKKDEIYSFDYRNYTFIGVGEENNYTK